MTEGALWDTAVIDVGVVQQRLLQFGCAVESGLGDEIGDAAIESFDETIGLRMARGAQPMLDAQGVATHVEGVFSAGRARGALESVGKASAVIGEQFDDAHWRALVQAIDEVRRTGAFHVGVEAHEHPACCPVDGHIEVTARRLVGHLRQVLDVYVDEAGFVILEALGLDRLDRFAADSGLQGAQVAHAVTAQATPQGRARQVGTDEFAGDDQEIVQGQQQKAAQLDDDELLERTERGAKLVRPVAAIEHTVTRAPFVHGRLGDVVAPGEYRRGLGGRLDFRADSRRGACQGMNGCHVVALVGSGFINSRRISRARSSGQLRTGQ